MKNTMIVDTQLGIVDYMLMVEDIVEEFYSDGKYQPQIGNLNAMRLFFNKCVICSKFDDRFNHNITDALDMEAIVVDAEFIREFNNAISDCQNICFNFGNAYRDAMDIIETNKNSISRIFASINQFLESVATSFSAENLDAIKNIADSISKNKIDEETLLDAYGKSKIPSKIAEMFIEK